MNVFTWKIILQKTYSLIRTVDLIYNGQGLLMLCNTALLLRSNWQSCHFCEDSFSSLLLAAEICPLNKGRWFLV